MFNLKTTLIKVSVIKSMIYKNLPKMVCKKVTVTFKEIKEIFLELNEIKNFQAPAERSMKTSTELFRQLTLQDLLSNVTKLQFDSINCNSSFKLRNLQELIINQTNMVEVKVNMFESLDSLKILDLQNNLISFIESNSFNNLLKLEKLVLSDNSIIIIQTNLLKNLINLKELYLENDGDDEMIIEYNAFDFLENLEILKISNYRLPMSDDIHHRISSFLSQSSKFLICLEQKPFKSLFTNLIQLKKFKLWVNSELDNNEFDTLINLEKLSLKFKSDKSIKSDMFDLMKNLRILNIHIIENLAKIDEKLFDKLFNLEELSLDVSTKHSFSISLLNHLKMLGKVVFKGIELRESNIKFFKDDKKVFCRTNQVFDLKNLQLIENEDTLEHFQDENVFENLATLNELNLEANTLLDHVLNKNSFGSLRNLRLLNLNLCNLTNNSLNNRVFEGITSLEELYLNENSIENIDSDWFSHLQNLKVLSIEMNQIRTIGQNSFNSLENLEELNLSNNLISQIQTNLFVFQKNLKNLLLSENELVTLNEFSLKGLFKLEELDLRANSIVSIKQNDFKDLTNLNVLLINRQKTIMDFDFGCLKFLKNLKHLFVQNNIDLKEYIYFERLDVNLHNKFLNTRYLKKIVNGNFLLEKDFDENFN
jgi:hypothetical protein